MKQWINKEMIGAFLLAICCTGSILCACKKDAQVEFVTQKELTSLMSESDTEVDFSDKTLEESKETVVAVVESDNNATEERQTLEAVVSDKIMVHVCGAVCNPGVYCLDAESRVIDAVEIAGGMTTDADSDYINLASKISDGDKVRIPTEAEAEELQKAGEQVDFITFANTDNNNLQKTSGGKVNINTADTELLCTLPGIGKTRAESIITYRQECGRFSKIEDIMNVSGIKENSFQKIKEYITVD